MTSDSVPEWMKLAVPSVMSTVSTIDTSGSGSMPPISPPEYMATKEALVYRPSGYSDISSVTLTDLFEDNVEPNSGDALSSSTISDSL